MELEEYKQKATILLGEYHKREAQIKLLQIEYQALEQLKPGISAVSYDQISARTNKVSSSVESEVERIEHLPEDLAKIQKQIVLLRMQNQKVDVILETIVEPFRSVLKIKYIDLLPWIRVYPKCFGYSEDYVRGEMKDRALVMFISLYYPEINNVGLFEYNE